MGKMLRAPIATLLHMKDERYFRKLMGILTHNRNFRKIIFPLLQPYVKSIHGFLVCKETFLDLPSIVDGTYEPYTHYLFTKILKEGDVVADVGAAHGYYTLTAAKVVGSKGRVYAFEPNPYLFKILLKNICLNKLNNVLAINKAVSERCSSARFYVLRGLESSLIDVRGIAEEPLKNIIEVKTVSLDEFLGENTRLDVVKIDIEGNEVNALLGMRRILERGHEMKMFIEFNPPLLVKAGFSPTKLIDILVKYNFRVYAIWEKERKIKCIKDTDMLVKHLSTGKRYVKSILCKVG
jgi:FkbM family methyltransferase